MDAGFAISSRQRSIGFRRNGSLPSTTSATATTTTAARATASLWNPRRYSAVTSTQRSSTTAVNGESTSTTAADATDSMPTTNIRLNVYEKARTVTSVSTSGTLCTISAHDGIQGSPFGSFVDYVLDDDGNPVLLMNEMSMHTINIQKTYP